jgi:hypothetical protein
MTEGDARQLAQEEFLMAPSLVLLAISNDSGPERLLFEIIDDMDEGLEVCASDLLTVIMNGSRNYACKAAMMLRQRLVDVSAPVLERTALSIWENYHAH